MKKNDKTPNSKPVERCKDTIDIEEILASKKPEDVVFNFPIIMNAIESSNIDAIGYNADNKLLRVNFKNGKDYFYSNVPQIIFAELEKAESRGSFLAKHIKGKYKCFEAYKNSENFVENKPCA